MRPTGKFGWVVINSRLDPWSANKLLKRAKRLGCTPSQALRYTLRRIKEPA